MNTEIIPIWIPKDNVSDEAYKLTEIYITNGSSIKTGDLIGSLETSKADIEIESPADGFLHYKVEEGDTIAVGALLAVITPDENFPKAYFDDQEKEAIPAKGNGTMTATTVRVSKKAQRLLEEHQIDPEVFTGKSLISYQDVKEYLDKGASVKPADKVAAVPAAKSYSSNQKIVIWGAGGHAKMCIDILRQMKTYEIIGAVASPLPSNKEVLGIPVIGEQDQLEALYNQGVRFAVLGIGALFNPALRSELYARLKKIGFYIPNIIHPSAIIEPSAKMGEGNQVMAGAVIGSDVSIGNNGIINSGSIISHDCIIKDNVHLTPGAILAGSVSIGDNTLVGMGATVLLDRKIGSNVMIHNGVNITKDIADYQTIKK